MLGSHFDLAKEIKAIAAKRGGDDEAQATRIADPAFEAFDLKLSAFLATIAPIKVDGRSNRAVGQIQLRGDHD